MTDSSAMEIWDRPSALRRLGGKEKLLDRLILLFINEASNHVAELQQAIETEDTVNVRILAHTIKGSAANVSALQLQALASKLEQAASHSDISDFKTLHTELKEAFNAFRVYISNDPGSSGDN